MKSAGIYSINCKIEFFTLSTVILFRQFICPRGQIFLKHEKDNLRIFKVKQFQIILL